MEVLKCYIYYRLLLKFCKSEFCSDVDMHVIESIVSQPALIPHTEDSYSQ